MILVPVQNEKNYYILLASDKRLEIYLICPDCNSCIFITWSQYSRHSLPAEREIIIQRMRCSACKATPCSAASFFCLAKLGIPMKR